MERLTTKIENKNFIPTALCATGRDGEVDDIDGCKEYCDHCKGECSDCAIQKCFNTLAEYENLEEQDLLLRLPCKVGDTVWELDEHKNITECKVVLFGFDLIGELYMFYDSKDGTFRSKEYISSFGKTVFLTQAEAEQKLKEMNEHDGE